MQLLIATMKYTGDDYEADMKIVSEDPETQKWWAATDGMQESYVDGATGSGKEVPWWAVSTLVSADRSLGLIFLFLRLSTKYFALRESLD